MLFNVYIHDLPDTVSRKYGYADDLAIMLSRPTWKAMEEGLNEDMGTLVAYLRRWRLQLSIGKSVAAAYHLSTREARRALEMTDPSQPNNEGITVLHNALCGGHYNVVDSLVCIEANVRAPDSHGW
ncbi:hypothetical protein NHX12_007998 [Muraenolepis orangiensis]|uniref:Reverse transcriptase domain-containing protein n=1 Tax=Muraenolepis orangiensis TaxID=630683 RepID=A0A9Q0DM21_9TELE|nr:hypothetical protein NHX12_007998 [Muraenolepis orangiensis]